MDGLHASDAPAVYGAGVEGGSHGLLGCQQPTPWSGALGGPHGMMISPATAAPAELLGNCTVGAGASSGNGARKRLHGLRGGAAPSGGAIGPSVSLPSCGLGLAQFLHPPGARAETADVDEKAVDALLPKMKRMRLRPSLGQLRLQREADDALASSLPQVRLHVEPEQLKALVTVGVLDHSFGGSTCSSLHAERRAPACQVQLEMSFPPQYPHRPPRVAQLSPEARLPGLDYDAQFVVLERLKDHSWSPAMGVMDIVQDLVQVLAKLGVGGLSAGDVDATAASGMAQWPHVQRAVAPAAREKPAADVDMLGSSGGSGGVLGNHGGGGGGCSGGKAGQGGHQSGGHAGGGGRSGLLRAAPLATPGSLHTPGPPRGSSGSGGAPDMPIRGDAEMESRGVLAARAELSDDELI